MDLRDHSQVHVHPHRLDLHEHGRVRPQQRRPLHLRKGGVHGHRHVLRLCDQHLQQEASHAEYDHSRVANNVQQCRRKKALCV